MFPLPLDTCYLTVLCEQYPNVSEPHLQPVPHGCDSVPANYSKKYKQTDIASDLSEPVHNAAPAISLTEKLGAIIVRLYIYLVKNICMQATSAEKLP